LLAKWSCQKARSGLADTALFAVGIITPAEAV
jgi:hypothetical protein